MSFAHTNIAFSGGRTSAFMLHRLIVQNGGTLPENYSVTFANTGMERIETLDFIDRISREWKTPVVWLEYNRDSGDHGFREVTYLTAGRSGKPLDEVVDWSPCLPNPRARTCTTQTKVRTMKRWLQSRGLTEWNECIGIRWDERDRSIAIKADCPKYINPTFPLIEAKVTEDDVMDFWSKQSFDLGLQQHEGNCDLCFLKARWKIVEIMRRKPELAQRWIEWEQRKKGKTDTPGGAVFREDRTYQGMFLESQHPTLFPMTGDDGDDEIPCGCADGGYRHEREFDGDPNQ